jgi:hypothetical protein
MEMKIKICVPKGYGTSRNKDYWEMRAIKKMVFRKARIKEEYVNDDGSELIWVVEVSARNYLSVVKNVTIYEKIVAGLFSNKHAKKALRRLADTPQDYDSMVDMMQKQTTIEIIKTATAEELAEANKSKYVRLKEWLSKKFDNKK